MAGRDEPTRLPSFKEQIPEWCRMPLYLLFLTAFQFSNGIYFTAMSQMQGTQAITMDDAKMMSHAVLIGLTLYFPFAFRLKSRFTNRTSLLIAATGLALCNLIVPYIGNPPMLLLIGFAAGFFRLYGTFECFSSILPKITPTYNYAVFLSFVFFVVLGVIHLFDALSLYVIHYYDWQHLHWLAIGLLLLVILLATTLMRPFRNMPRMPLYGIDWLGMVLWSIFILSLIFVAQYGTQLEWLNSPYIRAAIGSAFISLAFCIMRIGIRRHPFLEGAAFRVNDLILLLLSFLLLGILLASKNTLQHTFTAAVMHWDSFDTISYKLVEFAGALCGALFSWHLLVHRKWPHKAVAFMGFAMIFLYAASMYFIISPDVNLEALYLPLILCNWGHLAIFIALTAYIQSTAPFRYYFQILCILGFIRTGIASPIGDALYRRGIEGVMTSYLEANFSAESALTSTVQQLYGTTAIFCIILLLLFAIIGTLQPKFKI